MLAGVVLPSTLKTLFFGESFRQSLAQVALPTLKALRLGDEIEKTLEGVVLPSLEALTLSCDYHEDLGISAVF